LECGKQIINLYKEIENGLFVILNKETFKDIVENNIVFNFDELNNEMEVKLFKLKNEINEELLIRKQNYSKILEKILNIYFNKEGIVQKVNEFYLDDFKNIDNNQKSLIMNNINLIINYIKSYISSEAKRIKSTVTISFGNDYSKIKNTFNKFKIQILNVLNETYINLTNEFNQNIEVKFYKKYIQESLNKFSEELIIDSSIYKLLNYTFNFNEIIKNIIINLQNDYNTTARKQIVYKNEQRLKEIFDILGEINDLYDKELNDEFTKTLLPEIKKKVENNAGYEDYDFNINIKNNITTFLETKVNNILNIFNNNKGVNFNLDTITNWVQAHEITFSTQDIQNKVNVDILNDFKNFYELEVKYERNTINELLEEIIKHNFNNLLYYIIPSFGKNYFDRIIKYNENYKIIGLFNNLKFSISQTLSYYIIITISKDLSNLPKDLKIKLYNMNNLEAIIENYNLKILEIINKRSDEFIEYIQKFILNEYSTRFNNELLIDCKFNNDIMNMMKLKFHDMNSVLNKNCKNILEKYLKEPFIASYRKIMNEKTHEMMKFSNTQKELIRQNIFDKLTIDSDDILNTINDNLNKTESLISEYQSKLQTFQIDNEFIQFLNEYGKINIQPLFSDIIKLIKDANIRNKEQELQILKENSDKYEDLLNYEGFIDLSSNIHSFFEENYFKNITESIEIYGPKNYKENLEIEKMKYEKRNLRILEGTETEEDISNIFLERIADKALDHTFQKILNTSMMVKSFMNNLKEFKDFDDKIQNNIQKIKENYKESLVLIKEKKEDGIFDDELYNINYEKLNNLFNITLDYYNQINESYTSTKIYLIESIDNFYKSIIDCQNVTYHTFIDEYTKIKEEILPIPESENIYNSPNIKKDFTHYFNNENNGQIKYDLTVNSNKEAYFSVNLYYEDQDFKNLEVRAEIINLSGPKDIDMKILSGTSTCGEKKRNVRGNFGSANYTMLITFDTKSTKINVTTLTDFEDYIYDIKEYIIETQEGEDEFMEINGILINYGILERSKCIDVPYHEGDDTIKVEKKKKISTVLIDN